MATGKDSVGGFYHECSYRCESKKHASNLIATVIKSQLSDEKIAAYLKWACVRYPYAVDFYGRSLVHAAASTGRIKLLRFLLTYPDININGKEQESGYSPLHISLYLGELHCAVSLIKAGANIQLTDSEDLTPLDHVMKDRPDILNYDDNQPCEVYIWGMNTNYNLGIGHNHSRSNPDLLDYFRKENLSIRKAVIGKFHSLFLGSDGKVWTCGLGSGGRLGLGDETTALVPKAVKIKSHFAEFCITASIANDHSVLLMRSGAVWSFGLNNYHQLGHSEKLEKVLYPRQVQTLKGIKIIGISASKFHTVFWSKKQVFTCGLHGGQLGHVKEDQNTIPTPKVVQKLDTGHFHVKHAATSDGATVVVSTRGDVFLLHEYECKRLTPKHIPLDTKRICVLGGHLDHKVYSSCLQAKGGDELKIVILTEKNRIYLWEETFPHMTRCHLSLHRYIAITDMTLNRMSLMMTTSDGEAFHGEIKAKKLKGGFEDEKIFSLKSDINKNEKKDVYNYIKLKRIPHIHRAVSVSSDLKGRNFAIVQVHPKAALLQIPVAETSEMKQHMKSLLGLADEFDTLHDVVFEVGGTRFPAHQYVVSHSSLVLRDLINKSEIVDKVCHVKIENVDPQIFQRILFYMYTGECDLLKPGICPLSLNSLISDVKEPMKETLEDKPNTNNEKNVEQSKQQHGNKKKESKTDPIKSLRDAAEVFGLVNLSKILELLFYENGYIKKSTDVDIVLPQPKFDWKKSQNLWDVNLESESGETLKAHKCILVSRMEYFNCIINQGWLESSLKSPLKLWMPTNILEILISFLYTDEASELMKSDDLDLVSRVLVISDQYFCTKLKEIAEVSLCNMMSLKNVAEVLQLAITYNASQLKICAMEYICLNLSAILELQALEILDDSLLIDIKNFYRSWLPCMKYRGMGTHIVVADDDFIEAIYNSEPVSFDKIEEETMMKANSKNRKKKSQKEKRTSESKTYRLRKTSSESVTSDEEIFTSLDYSDFTFSDGDETKESTWITVTNHSNRQQRLSQAKSKAKTSEISKSAVTTSPKASPVIPIQKGPVVPSQGSSLKKDNFIDLERDSSFLSTSLEKEFPALSASAPDRICTINTPRSPGGSSKKFVKLSQKQRKKIAYQSKSEDEESITKTVQTVKPVWGIPKYESRSLSDIMKEEIKTNSQQPSASARSPPWSGPSSPNCSLSAIMAAERQQRDFISKMKSKPLEYTQMEDKAIDDLMLLYDVANVTDERITVRRADIVLFSPPVWVSNHR